MVAKFRNPNFGKCFTIYYFKLYSELIEIAGQDELIEIAGQGYIRDFQWKFNGVKSFPLEL